MNFALPALILLALLTPGLALRMAYLGGPYGRRSFTSSFLDEFIWAIIPGIIIHGFFVSLFQIIGFGSFPWLLLKLIAAASNLKDTQFVRLSHSLWEFSLYIIILTGLAYMAGQGLRNIVEKRRLDLRYYFLRINNDWHYILKSYSKVVDGKYSLMKPENIILDLQISKSSSTVLYTGQLKDYSLTRDGNIDILQLSWVFKRDFSGLEPSSDAVNLPSDLFIVKYADVENINIRYIQEPSPPPH